MAVPFLINQKVVLEVLDGADRGTYPTRVEEVGRDGVVLAAPLVGRRALQLPPGARVRLKADGKRAGVSTMETSVRESLPVAPERRIPVIVLEPEGKVEQVQRRADVRMEVDIPIRYGILASPEDTGDGAPQPMWPTLEATLVDISAGGAQILTDIRLVSGAQLDVHLRLPDSNESLQLVAEVMRVLRSEARRGHEVHWVAVRWVGAESRDRDAIVGFIFREQVRRRRRGLL
ncbi:MAG: flagellar brake protein [Bacillota bacterium]